MKRRDMFKAGAAIGAASLAGPALAQGAKVLKFVPAADLTLVDPVFNTALVTRTHGMLVFDQLYGLDESFNVQPQMAEGHVIEDDGKSWKITLREGLTFHDGTPVLARDCIASINRWTQADVLGRNIRAVTLEMNALSDRVLQIRLSKPFPMLATALAKPSAFCPIMPARLAAQPPTTQVTEVVGSGPFRWVAAERVAGSRAVYERFAGYKPRPDGTPSFLAGPKIPYLDRVEWHTLPDAATAAAALQQGEVDWWESPAPDLLPLLRRRNNIQVEVKDRAGTMGMIRFNHLQPPFDNPAIRRAFLAGINQADYMTAVMGSDPSLWNARCGFFLPGSPLATEAGLEVMNGAPNLEKVKRDLAAAGYKGERVTFVVPTDFAVLNAQSEIAGDMFRRVGINLDYQASDWGSVASRLPNQGGLEAGGWSVWANIIPGVIAINPATQSYVRGPGKAGTYGWPDLPKIEALRDQFMDAGDPEQQKRLVRDIQLQAFQDVPYLPTGLYYQPTAFLKSVTGIPSGFPLFHNVRKS
ncbi:ABC transporter substrate-binding protein [Pararoseomonas indoligenes]|uniref:ABC transporter substrate-binding protein n=1 Tax=Roseomonas indoligenes TaxID=2820811 RepID=A0A940N8T5_9PROT|nr:ABC transporter substrate-binding protein [Pararoseomonas indoligenes]MBP0496147.1 ABC transporter substrate-binding protein [Pararoseomonas indoligenes]